MRVHVHGAEHAVGVFVLFAQRLGSFEAVDEEGGAARAVGVREEVECLQPCWVAEVGIVRVRGERDVGVCGVGFCEVRGEVVEGAVVGFTDEGDAFEEVFCGLRGLRDFFDVAEAEAALGRGVSLLGLEL
jgi:hypothetical protein